MFTFQCFVLINFEAWRKYDAFCWQDWDTIIETTLDCNYSKKLWAMIHKTSTHVHELLLLVWSRQTFYLNFFKKLVQYGRFMLPIICVIHTSFTTFSTYKDSLSLIDCLLCLHLTAAQIIRICKCKQDVWRKTYHTCV